MTADIFLTQFIYNLPHNPTLNTIAEIITDYTLDNVYVIIGIGIILTIIFLKNRKKELAPTIILYFAGIALITLLVYGLKIIIMRDRPFTTGDITTSLIVIDPKDYSFPSSHSAIAFFIAAYISNIFPKLKADDIFLYLFATTVALTRVYLGVHYVSDIIAGALLGIATAYLFLYFQKIIIKRNEKKIKSS